MMMEKKSLKANRGPTMEKDKEEARDAMEEKTSSVTWQRVCLRQPPTLRDPNVRYRLEVIDLKSGTLIHLYEQSNGKHEDLYS